MIQALSFPRPPKIVLKKTAELTIYVATMQEKGF